MKHVIDELGYVRQMGRTLLLLQTGLLAAAVLVGAALACGFLDYLLRLPGWLRLVIGLGLVAVIGFWAASRLLRAAGFSPDLSMLALRAERMYPQLSGALAAGVEFSVHADRYADPETTAGMAKASVADAQRRLGKASLSRMLNPTQTYRSAAMLAAVVIVLAGVVSAAPAASLLAAQRWFAPLGDAQWPRRTEIESLTRQQVWPMDAPVNLQAAVRRGYRSGMRAWVHYRLQGPAGPLTDWRAELLSEQASAPTAAQVQAQDQAAPNGDAPPTPSSHNFDRLVDLTNDLTGFAAPGAGGTGGTGGMGGGGAGPVNDVTMTFYFAAGDDQTQPQTLKLVRRPGAARVTAVIEPPVYAEDLVEPKDVRMDDQASRVAMAGGWIGSQVQLRVELNKPIPQPADADGWRQLLPGFATAADAVFEATPVSGPAANRGAAASAGAASASPMMAGFDLTFMLRDTLETALVLQDEHGLENLSDRLYRLEAMTDQSPHASLAEPPADQTVLPGALVDVAGLARDDVGVDWLALEAVLPGGGEAAEAAPQPAADGPNVADAAANDGAAKDGQGADAANATQLKRVELRAATGEVDHQIDLSTFELKPGDEVVLYAAARDVYELDGLRHEVQRSAPRRLRIIDQATLLGEIRTELAGLRQQAIRMDQRQQAMLDQPAGQAERGQRQMTRQLQRQNELIGDLKKRLDRNRLDESQLNKLLDESSKLLQEGEDASSQANQKLAKANQADADQNAQREAAKTDQQQVSQSLVKLISLLDQGGDALTLQLQLREMQATQEAVANDTREMLPRTMGKRPDQLTPQERKDLDNLANRQKALAEQADALTRQMQSASENLRKQGDSQEDEAAAQALAEAAAIAQRQGLQQKMQQAGQQAGENKLSQAGDSQQQAAQVMQEMLKQLNETDKRQKEMLRRMLAELEDAIKRLIDQQRAQIQTLQEAQAITGLDKPLQDLRRNTLTVQDKAQQSDQTKPVAALLGEAADRQADGVRALRDDDRNAAQNAQTQALTKLEEALALVRKQQQEQQEEEQREQREELRQKYLARAKRQTALREETAKVAGQGARPTRRDRARMMQWSNDQADIRMDANEIGEHEDVQKRPLFVHQHDQIREDAGAVVADLRGGAAGAVVLQRQDSVAMSLNLMAEALRQANEEEDFDNPQNQQAGGGGGGGQEPPLVPPIAELRLLRGIQEHVYVQTRQLDDVGAGAAAEADPKLQQRILELSARQRELAGLGEKLIEELQQQMQQAEQQAPPQPAPQPEP